MPSPMARAIGGIQSQSPSHDTARNRPMTVATDASAGHSLSQKMVQRARTSARVSTSLPAPCGSGTGWEFAASAGRSVKPISSKENLPILTCNRPSASGEKEGTS